MGFGWMRMPCECERMRNLNMIQVKISQIIPKKNGLVVPLRPYSESTKRWTKFWFASGHLCEFPPFSVNEQNKLFVIIWTNTNCPTTYNQICIISGFTGESNFFEEWFNILRKENVDELLQNLTLSIKTKGSNQFKQQWSTLNCYLLRVFAAECLLACEKYVSPKFKPHSAILIIWAMSSIQ